MSHPTHHLFFSYSRRDNNHGAGWITAFYKRLQTQHQAYTGRELRIFFDTEEIDDGSDWRARLGQGLRTSRLFLAFLSPNYIRSPNCRWEWEEYLRREHTQARGDDGIATVYFEIVPRLPGSEGEDLQQLEAELCADQTIAAWLDLITNEMSRRNMYLDPQDVSTTGKFNSRAAFDLRPWFAKGPEILAELDAAERLDELRQNPHTDTDQVLTLAQRLEELDKRIATRLDRCLLADFAPGGHSLGRSYPHFVGRHRELRELHQALITERMGVVTAVHGLGGQGKTALAIQYAHAYAEFYAAGGRWVVPCEGVKTMPEALLRLARQPGLEFQIPGELQNDPRQAAQFVLRQLELFTRQNAEGLLNRLQQDREVMSEISRLPGVEPRLLVIFDNVDQPSLLAADQTALLPQAEWFETIVTTRLDPSKFGLAKSDLRTITVDSLPIDDAVALMRDFQPDQRFASDGDEASARRLCEELGGFTLAVELVGAHLGEHPEIQPAAYCDALLQAGLPTADDLAQDADVASQIRHREKQLSIVLEETLVRLDEKARFVLSHAAFLSPDFVMLDWLRQIAAASYAELRPLGADRQQAIDILREIMLQNSDEGNAEMQMLITLIEDPDTAGPVIEMLRASVAADDESEGSIAFLSLLDSLAAPIPAAAQADPWLDVWRQLRGLRLLTPSEDVAAVADEQAMRRGVDVPQVARVHRLIAAHIVSRLSEEDKNESLDRIVGSVFRHQREFEQAWQHDAGVHWQVRPLAENGLHLLEQRPSSRELAMACGVAGQAEMALGQLILAGQLISACATALRQGHEANPNSAQAARDVSVSCERLGDFYLLRGASGDAERALAQFEESLRIRKQLYEANPNSAQAARDVSVSLNQLGDFYLRRGASGDAERALAQFEESLRIRKQLYEANPNSAQAARDVSVSCERLGDFYLLRGASGDAERALAQFEESLRIRKQLYEANPNSAQAARDVSVSCERLGDFYLSRGASGDAERALAQFEESLRMDQQLYEANPNSAQAARDLSVSYLKLSQIYQHLEQTENASQSLAACFSILDHFHRERRPMDQAMRDLHAQLAPLFGKVDS